MIVELKYADMEAMQSAMDVMLPGTLVWADTYDFQFNGQGESQKARMHMMLPNGKEAWHLALALGYACGSSMIPAELHKLLLNTSLNWNNRLVIFNDTAVSLWTTNMLERNRPEADKKKKVEAIWPLCERDNE